MGRTQICDWTGVRLALKELTQLGLPTGPAVRDFRRLHCWVQGSILVGKLRCPQALKCSQEETWAPKFSTGSGMEDSRASRNAAAGRHHRVSASFPDAAYQVQASLADKTTARHSAWKAALVGARRGPPCRACFKSPSTRLDRANTLLSERRMLLQL